MAAARRPGWECPTTYEGDWFAGARPGLRASAAQVTRPTLTGGARLPPARTKFTPTTRSFPCAARFGAILAHAGADPYRANLHKAYSGPRLRAPVGPRRFNPRRLRQVERRHCGPAGRGPVLVPRPCLKWLRAFNAGRFAVKDGALEWSGVDLRDGARPEADARTLPSANLRVLPASPPSPIDYAAVLAIARTTGMAWPSKVGYARAVGWLGCAVGRGRRHHPNPHAYLSPTGAVSRRGQGTRGCVARAGRAPPARRLP